MENLRRILNENPIQKQYDAILKRIKKERQKLGLSQYDFGEKIGISQNAYFKIETGKTKLDLYRFIHIAVILQLEPKTLLGNFKR